MGKTVDGLRWTGDQSAHGFGFVCQMNTDMGQLRRTVLDTPQAAQARVKRLLSTVAQDHSAADCLRIGALKSVVPSQRQCWHNNLEQEAGRKMMIQQHLQRYIPLWEAWVHSLELK